MIIAHFIVAGLAVILGVNTVLYLKGVYRTHFSLHLVLVPGTIIMAAPLFWLFTYSISGNMLQAGALFFALHCIGLPFVVAWGEAFTKRMQTIAARGDFQLGLPAPSKGHVLLGMFGQLYQDLAEAIVAVEGTEKLNMELERIGTEHPILLHTSISDDGEFKVDERILPSIGKKGLQVEGFLQFLDYLIQLNSTYMPKSSVSQIQRIMKNKAAGTLAKYLDLLIQEGLLDRLGGGIFSERASTGFLDFDRATGGGIPKETATLLCSPPSDERERFMRQFLLQGLRNGERCLYVSSSHPPRELLSSFEPEYSDRLMIVDCYTNRVAEVPTIIQDGNIVTTPVELSVVKVAISRAMDKSQEVCKRAIVDILPTYLIFNSVDRICIDLLEIVDDLRKSGYTPLFSLNPYIVDDEKKILTLEELFDGVIILERVPDNESSVSKREMLIHVEKMARTSLHHKDIRVAMATVESRLTAIPGLKRAAIAEGSAV